MHIDAASTGSRIGSTDPHGLLTGGAGETEHVPTEVFAFRTTRLPATCRTEPTDHLLHQLTEASWVARSMPASHAAGVLGALTERDRSQQDKSLLRHPLLATDRALPRVTTSGPSRRPVVPADDGPQNVIALFGAVLSCGVTYGRRSWKI